MVSLTLNGGKIPFEEALAQTGYGLYSYLIVALAGSSAISTVSLAYGSTIIVPASACELDTTSAQQGLMVGVPIAGSLIGSLIWGYLGDTRGRRRMLFASLVLAATGNVLASISVNWIMLMIVQLITVTLGAGIYPLSMTLLSESVPLQNRNVAILLVTSMFLLAQGLISVMAIPMIPLTFSYYLEALGIYWNSWRTLQVMYSVSALVCAGWLLLMQESPKFVLASGDEERALRILRTIHRTNNSRRREEFHVKGLLPETGSTETNASVKEQVLPLFLKPHLKNTLIIASLFILYQIVEAFLIWGPTIANQFMELLETGQGSDLTLCQIIASDVADDFHVPAGCSLLGKQHNSTAMLLLLAMCGLHSVLVIVLSQVMDKAGQRNSAMAITAFSGVAGVLINLVPNAIGTAVLFLAFSVAVIVMGCYISITVALFPTHLRSIAVSTTMIGTQLMSVGYIQLVNYLLANYCELGFYILSTIFACSALVLSLLPDDRRLRTAPEPTDGRSERTDAQHEMSTAF